jgi:L-serine deaminase
MCAVPGSDRDVACRGAQPAIDPIVNTIDMVRNPLGLICAPVGKCQHGIQRAAEAAHAIDGRIAKLALLGDSRGHERVSELEQHGATPSKDDDALSVQLPGNA